MEAFAGAAVVGFTDRVTRRISYLHPVLWSDGRIVRCDLGE